MRINTKLAIIKENHDEVQQVSGMGRRQGLHCQRSTSVFIPDYAKMQTHN